MVKINKKLISTNIITGQEVATNEFYNGKQIFAKEIDIGALPNTNVITVILTETGYVDTLLRFSSRALSSTTGIIFILPRLIWLIGQSTLASSISVDVFKNTNGQVEVNLRTQEDRTAFNHTYVTIWYTKN